MQLKEYILLRHFYILLSLFCVSPPVVQCVSLCYHPVSLSSTRCPVCHHGFYFVINAINLNTDVPLDRLL